MHQQHCQIEQLQDGFDLTGNVQLTRLDDSSAITCRNTKDLAQLEDRSTKTVLCTVYTI
jgi:hypothetical protein